MTIVAIMLALGSGYLVYEIIFNPIVDIPSLTILAWIASISLLAGVMILSDRKPQKKNSSLGFIWDPVEGWQEHIKFAWRPWIKSPKKTRVFLRIEIKEESEGYEDRFFFFATPDLIREIVADDPFKNPRETVEEWFRELTEYLVAGGYYEGDRDRQKWDKNKEIGWYFYQATIIKEETFENGSTYRKSITHTWDDPPTRWEEY